LYQIAITLIPNGGPITAKQLISYCGGPKAVFEARKKELLTIPNIGEKTVASILQKGPLVQAEQEVNRMEKLGIQALYYLDDNYPQRLKHNDDAPIILFYKGNADLNPARTVGIVGTRKATVFGKAFTEELVEGLASYGVTVMSGLAYGIDITAHQKCVEVGIPTIGVLGHGLKKIYPIAHQKTAQRMVEQGGLLTEYIFDQDPDREHFPMRNRIIAGMSDALIVVETAAKGGSMITANLAFQYNKDVFAVPGRIKDPMSIGCNRLIKSHRAALMESVKDLAYVMRWEEIDQQKQVQTQLFVELSPEETQVVEMLRTKERLSIDHLSRATQQTNSTMASILLSLEFKGLVKTLPGKHYVLV